MQRWARRIFRPTTECLEPSSLLQPSRDGAGGVEQRVGADDGSIHQHRGRPRHVLQI